MTDTIEQLIRERDEARAEVLHLRALAGSCTGLFARHRGLCEPIEGYRERPQDLPDSVRAMSERLRAAEAVCEAATAWQDGGGAKLLVALDATISAWRKLTENRNET